MWDALTGKLPQQNGLVQTIVDGVTVWKPATEVFGIQYGDGTVSNPGSVADRMSTVSSEKVRKGLQLIEKLIRRDLNRHDDNFYPRFETHWNEYVVETAMEL